MYAGLREILQILLNCKKFRPFLGVKCYNTIYENGFFIYENGFFMKNTFSPSDTDTYKYVHRTQKQSEYEREKNFRNFSKFTGTKLHERRLCCGSVAALTR